MKRQKVRSPVLVNAAEMARQHPETFGRPSKQELDSIKSGSLVKVCDGAKRFWTEVISREGETIIARVDSMIGFGQQDYSYGDLIRFGADNIYDIHER
jgi:hypothetical protein